MLKIALLGPESTGKTSLARRLAAQKGCPWVDEYARHYVEQLRRPYTRADLDLIAREQIRREVEAEQIHATEPLVLFDTETINLQVWYSKAFGSAPEMLAAHQQLHPMAAYLLCRPDLSWQPDPVRENPDCREELFQDYLQSVQRLHTPYYIIEGTGDGRFLSAVRAVEHCLGGNTLPKKN